MNVKKAFLYSLSLLLLILLSLWVSKLLNYPPPIQVVYDQDAVINATWRVTMGLLGIGASGLLFMLLTLYVYLKRLLISVYRKNP